ncbi:MAG: universal stress protein [Marinobacterium sp.]|nr:universal stress protein [Marinobacterium sp.]
MFAKVLVPVDLAELDFAHKALELAIREVKASNGELHLISVVPGFSNSMVASFISEKEHHDVLARVAAELKQFAADEIPEEINVVLRVVQGSPAEEVNRYIKKQGVELAIMRAHHRTRVGEFLLGSVSSRVVERARCSVVVLKD